ncbi:MAG: translational GTPase TypA, partial [Candidatus Harrisonbacteria bacterium CG10_big_fil_rev_8_21_14_0_10_38_8]
VFNLAYDNFLGRLGVARIYEGTLNEKQEVFVKDSSDGKFKGRINKLFTFEGLKRKEVKSAKAGDIVMIAGLPDIFIGQTILQEEGGLTLPVIAIDEPTISFYMFVNDSPFAGRVGKYVTSRQIRERLEKELEVNVGLKVDFEENARMKVYGRGELHLAILIENMRREGFELAVSQPEVIYKEEDGVKLEPYEEASVLVPEEYSGVVIEKLGKRRGVMTSIEPEHGEVRLNFEVPTRGLLGYRNELVVDTRGKGVLTSIFTHFGPFAGEVQKTELGSMVSMATGKALGFSLDNLQDRGVLYIEPNIDVYEGMVIGNTAKGEDMYVNPTKGKQLSNMRSSGADEAIKLSPPMDLTLEKALGFMRADEYLEVTPEAVRLRKQHLTKLERSRNKS